MILTGNVIFLSIMEASFLPNVRQSWVATAILESINQLRDAGLEVDVRVYESRTDLHKLALQEDGTERW